MKELKLRMLPGTYQEGTAVKLIHEGVADSFAAVIYGKDGLKEANAAHIVHCVNNFEAVRDILAELLHDINNPNFTAPRKAICETAIRAKAILEQAKKGAK